MAQLIFKGPFHFSQLESLRLKGKVGIYIWGFAFNLVENGQLKEPIDFSDGSIPVPKMCLNKNNEPIGCDFIGLNWKFIPYYVGRAQLKEKGTNSIKKRIIDHLSVDATSKDANTYLRLNKCYYKSFFKDPDFPINKSGGPWINTPVFLKKLNTNFITYFNDPNILTNILYPSCTPQRDFKRKRDRYPINLQNYISYDSLKDIVKNEENFWFCYLDMTGYSDSQIEKAEPQTFYSLNGKTISKTIDFKLVENTTIIYAYSTCEDIFNLDSATKKLLPQDPNDPKSFPGY